MGIDVNAAPSFPKTPKRMSQKAHEKPADRELCGNQPVTRVPGEASEACKFDFYAAHGRALRERDDAVVLREGGIGRAREEAGEERVDAVREQPTLDLRGKSNFDLIRWLNSTQPWTRLSKSAPSVLSFEYLHDMVTSPIVSAVETK